MERLETLKTRRMRVYRKVQDFGVSNQVAERADKILRRLSDEIRELQEKIEAPIADSRQQGLF